MNDMLIVEMKKHFQLRAIEWWSASSMATWGIFVLLFPTMFKENPACHALLVFAPQHVWGLVATLAGGVRLVALLINGMWYRTPAVRWVCTMISIFVWFSITAAFTSSPIINTGVVVYGWHIFADMYSAYRSAVDFIEAEAQARMKALRNVPLPEMKENFTNVRHIATR